MTAESIAGKRIALIGGAGFIGHNMALELKKKGAEVSIIDGLTVNNLLYLQQSNNPLPNKEMYLQMVQERFDLLKDNHIPMQVQDARDYHKLGYLLDELKPQIIVVLAAVSHANRSNKDPYTTFDHSFRTLENSLDFARGNAEHLIYFSSSMVYGNFEAGSVTEESICNPLGIYGALKYGGEKLVIAYNQVFDLPYTIIRPSALYGERCISRRVGQIFIENAMAGKPIVVQGDGSDKLDFTYIQDLVHGVIRVMEEPAARNEIFNLTYGASRSLKELIAVLSSEFPDLDINYEPRDRLMPERGTLSVEKARQMIGYNPQYPIEKGIREYIAWYKENYVNR